MKYRVIQQHYGDQQYFEGDVRVVTDEYTARQLLAMKLIAPLDDEPMADKPKARTKAEKSANKAQTLQDKAES